MHASRGVRLSEPVSPASCLSAFSVFWAVLVVGLFPICGKDVHYAFVVEGAEHLLKQLCETMECFPCGTEVGALVFTFVACLEGPFVRLRFGSGVRPDGMWEPQNRIWPFTS